MIQYEANLNGTVEVAKAFTEFDEGETLLKLLREMGWSPQPPSFGRGGYYRIGVKLNERNLILHVYLKKLTFGGRENRPYEKRAQFSAGLDRAGFEVIETDQELSLILAIYRREKYSDVILCAWSTGDWGYNAGRAFNCFVDIHSIAMALRVGLNQHQTASGQIACCFRPHFLKLYLENRALIHSELIPEESFDRLPDGSFSPESLRILSNAVKHIPKFEELLIPVIKVLVECGGTASASEIETRVGDLIGLSPLLKKQIHNSKEGQRTELGYQLAWARNYLKRAGYIISHQKSIWRLTERYTDDQPLDKNEIKRLALDKDVAVDLLREVQTDESNEDIEKEIGLPFEITTPFDPNKVDIKTKTMSLDLLLRRMSRNEIDLNTSFQRKAGLWNVTQQSRLIESILIRFPLPAFYFDGSDDEKWLVVDGLQRLSSLNSFVNQKSFALQNLEFLGQLNGMTFPELSVNLRRRIEEFEITAYIISPGTPKPLKFIVFKRINTGGLVLTSQEIRNAIYQGKPAELLKSLVELRSFKKATSFAIQEDRMMDREFATRFVAFYLTSFSEYDGDLDHFLNSALESIYGLHTDQLLQLRDHFDGAMITAYDIFGEDAFRKRYVLDDGRKPLNKALFEVWSVLLAKLDPASRNHLSSRKESVRRMFIELLNNDTEFNAAISASTGDKSRVSKRFLEIDSIIQSALR